MLRYDIRTGVKKIKTRTAIALSILGLGASGSLGSLALLGSAHAIAPPDWNTSGSYKIDFSVDPNSSSYDSNLYDLNLTQTGSNLSGTGQYPSPGPYAYAWTATGTITGNTISLTDVYTLGAVGTTMHMSGTVAADGTMSGTWDDNYGGGRTGLWKSVSGTATPIVNGCNFDESIPGVWTLLSDCTATAEIYIPTNTTLDGGNHTITAGFQKTDSSNNAVLGVVNDANVTIRNLTINGAVGNQLHGINTYVSTNVSVTDVTLNNTDRAGLVVNGTDVTVSNVTTANSGWEGIDVDSGSGVTQPSTLNVVGPMNQFNDVRDIYVDSTTKSPASTVNDILNQYTFQNNVNQTGDRLYTEKAIVPSTKDQCMNSGWKNFQTSFKNQGQCVSYVNHHDGNGADDTHAH